MSGKTGKPLRQFRDVLAELGRDEIHRLFDREVPDWLTVQEWTWPKAERKSYESKAAAALERATKTVLARLLPVAEAVFFRQSERTRQILTLLGWPRVGSDRLTYKDAATCMAVTGPSIRGVEMRCLNELRAEINRKHATKIDVDPLRLSSGG